MIGAHMSSETSKFHKSKKSAAVLKHAIIDSYAPPFIGKTGKWAADNRVAFIDGYAGPGRYDDGSEGSGAMLMRHARKHAPLPRNVELHFVEDDATTVAKLREVVADEGKGLKITITDGDISHYLPELLKRCDGIPLFAYLDPCGLVIPLEEVASIFDRPSGHGAPATEVLINFTAHIRRFAGHLTSDKPVEASLKRMDAVCGGDWWRDTWLSEYPDRNASEVQKVAAEEAVVEGYAEKLRERAGVAGTWVIDVRPRADLKPLYYLVFATRHVDGMLAFGESASLGLQEWRKYHAEVAAQGTLFGENGAWEKNWKTQEELLKKQWVDKLAARLTAELAKGEAFRIVDRAEMILGDDLVGVVRTLHMRAAINKARNEGRTTTQTVGVKDMLSLLITPA